MTHEQHIDQIIREWYWKPFASPYEAAKDILKLFGKRREEHTINRIVWLIQYHPWPWDCTKGIMEVVNAAKSRRTV